MLLVTNAKSFNLYSLSRDIYVDNIYMKSSAGRLPIKWLALESMTDQKYTSQSDVYVKSIASIVVNYYLGHF